MPGADNVMTRKLHASAMFRRAALWVAARLRVLPQLLQAQAAHRIALKHAMHTGCDAPS